MPPAEINRDREKERRGEGVGKRTRARHADELNRGATAERRSRNSARHVSLRSPSLTTIYTRQKAAALPRLSSSLVCRDSLRTSIAYSTFLPHYHLLARPVVFRILILEHRAYFISRYVRSRRTSSSFRHVFFQTFRYLPKTVEEYTSNLYVPTECNFRQYSLSRFN